MRRPWTSLGLFALLLATTSACVAYEPGSEMVVKDPSRVSVETFGGQPVLAPGATTGQLVAENLHARRDDDGAVSVNGTEIVGRDGSVDVRVSLDGIRGGEGYRVPVCYHRTHRSCRRVIMVTPVDNVGRLRTYQEPVRILGVMELLIAGALLGVGGVAEAHPSGQTTTGGGLALAGGGTVALVGLIQLFHGRKDVVDAVADSP
jgi:hypothetical protein